METDGLLAGRGDADADVQDYGARDPGSWSGSGPGAAAEADYHGPPGDGTGNGNGSHHRSRSRTSDEPCPLAGGSAGSAWSHPAPPQYNSAFLQKVQLVFSHYYVTLAGNAVALANVVCICTVLVLNAEKSTLERNDHYLEIMNCCFIFWYLLEMSLKIVAFGLRGYVSYRNNVFDGFITLLLMALQITIFINYRVPFSQWQPVSRGLSFWDMVRLVNLLIVF
ncbi:hypothetical protein CRUP_015397, partial [Coryphaenoides rupestris]